MKFAKFSIVLLFLLSLVAFALTTVLFSVRENEKEKRIKLEKIKIELEANISTLESDKKKLQEQADSLDAQLKDATKNLTDARAQAEQTKQDLAESKKSLDAQNAQMEELKKAVRVSQERNRELEATLDKMEKNLEEMKHGQPDVLGSTSLGASAAIDLAPKTSPETITVETATKGKVMELAPAEPPSTPSKEPVQKNVDDSQKPKAPISESLQAGRVLLVNQKFNFVIVNMGSKQGVKIGDSFLVTENGEKVVKVQVEKLYDDYSAAKIAEVIGNRLILKEGNLVTRA